MSEKKNKFDNKYKVVLKRINDNGKTIKILDLGSCFGYIWKDKPLNWVVTGVDSFVETNNVEFYEKRDVFEFLEKNTVDYDYIVALDIIEHLENPHKFLRLINQNLAKNGKLILTTPNNSHYASRLSYIFFGRPHHFFSKSSIEDLGHITILPMYHLEHMMSKYFSSYKKDYICGNFLIPFVCDFNVLPKSDLTSDIVLFECDKK